MPRIATPGDLRERVKFERRRLANDGYGNSVTNNWAELYCCAARIMPLRSGDERVDARRLTGFQTVAITVRISSALCDLIPDDRAVDVRSGVIYDIRSIANFDEHGRYLEIGAVKRDVEAAPVLVLPPPIGGTVAAVGSAAGIATAAATAAVMGVAAAVGSASGTSAAAAATIVIRAAAGSAAAQGTASALGPGATIDLSTGEVLPMLGGL